MVGIKKPIFSAEMMNTDCKADNNSCDIVLIELSLKLSREEN